MQYRDHPGAAGDKTQVRKYLQKLIISRQVTHQTLLAGRIGSTSVLFSLVFAMCSWLQQCQPTLKNHQCHPFAAASSMVTCTTAPMGGSGNDRSRMGCVVCRPILGLD